MWGKTMDFENQPMTEKEFFKMERKKKKYGVQ